jgi:hypothetical protein
MGKKTRHMGMKWLRIDDQFSAITPSHSKVLGSDSSFPYLEDDFLVHLPVGPNNVTFEIPEDPEFSPSEPAKLALDAFPGLIKHPRIRSRKPQHSSPPSQQPAKYRSPWYVSPTQWAQLNAPRPPFDESARLRNLYYHLHEASSQRPAALQLSAKHAELQTTLRSLPLAADYKNYLQQNNMRVPAHLRSIEF